MLVAIVAITPTNIAITPRYGWVLKLFGKNIQLFKSHGNHFLLVSNDLLHVIM